MNFKNVYSKKDKRGFNLHLFFYLFVQFSTKAIYSFKDVILLLYKVYFLSTPWKDYIGESSIGVYFFDNALHQLLLPFLLCFISINSCTAGISLFLLSTVICPKDIPVSVYAVIMFIIVSIVFTASVDLIAFQSNIIWLVLLFIKVFNIPTMLNDRCFGLIIAITLVSVGFDGINFILNSFSKKSFLFFT